VSTALSSEQLDVDSRVSHSKVEVVVLLPARSSLPCSSCSCRAHHARSGSLPPGHQALDGKPGVKYAQAGVKFSAASAQGFFRRPDHPVGPVWQNILMNTAPLTWQLDLLSSNTQLLVSPVGTRVLNPRHRRY